MSGFSPGENIALRRSLIRIFMRLESHVTAQGLKGYRPAKMIVAWLFSLWLRTKKRTDYDNNCCQFTLILANIFRRNPRKILSDFM